MMRLLLIALVFVPFEALADSLRSNTRPCRVERFDFAYANCVNDIADRIEIEMAAHIGQVLSSLQAPTQPELAALEMRYTSAQTLWRDTVMSSCNEAFGQNVRARSDCRLAATLDRQSQLAISLARAADDLGGTSEYHIPVPDAVDVFIPLPGSPNGPRQRIRVPLTVPVSPR